VATHFAGSDLPSRSPDAPQKLVSGDIAQTPESSAATKAGELTHWTKRSRRRNRDFSGRRFSDTGYAREELVAEVGAAFLCADLGITPEAIRRVRWRTGRRCSPRGVAARPELKTWKVIGIVTAVVVPTITKDFAASGYWAVSPPSNQLTADSGLTAFLNGAALTGLLRVPGNVAAHRSGCHRWHSCPSHRGTYGAATWGVALRARLISAVRLGRAGSHRARGSGPPWH
jgi:hypothetical protein